MRKALPLSMLSISLLMAMPAFATNQPVSKEQAVQKQDKKTEYKVKLYNVPYSVLGVNSQDPRYNQDAKMYFALNEKGYYPLMNMLISSENRNPFTATQIIAGFGYVNKWDFEVKNNLALLNRMANINILQNKALIEDKISAKLNADQAYLTGLYFTSKVIDEWKRQKPQDGYERLNSDLFKINQLFASEVDKTFQGNSEYQSKMKEIYTNATKSLKNGLAGNIDVQFYLRSLLYRDELLRQITEVAILNTLNPDEIGIVNFAADLLIKDAQDAKIALIINPYYQQNNERNSNIKYIEVPFIGKYERVYQDDEKLGKAFGINHSLEIEPTKHNVKGLNVKLFNNNEPLNLTALYNPNGRGLDIFNEVEYYLEPSKDNQFLIMYVNPSEGNTQRFIFKRVQDLKPFVIDDNNPIVVNIQKTLEQGDLPNVDLSMGKPKTVFRSWYNIVGNNFLMSEDEAADAGYNWNSRKTYGVTPSTEQCGIDNTFSDNCIERVKNSTVFVDGADIGIEPKYYCKDYTNPKIGLAKIQLSHNVRGAVYSSNEQTKDFDRNYVAFSVPVKDNNVTQNLCVVNTFDDGEVNAANAVKLSNSIINYLNKGEN